MFQNNLVIMAGRSGGLTQGSFEMISLIRGNHNTDGDSDSGIGDRHWEEAMGIFA